NKPKQAERRAKQEDDEVAGTKSGFQNLRQKTRLLGRKERSGDEHSRKRKGRRALLPRDARPSVDARPPPRRRRSRLDRLQQVRGQAANPGRQRALQGAAVRRGAEEVRGSSSSRSQRGAPPQ